MKSILAILLLSALSAPPQGVELRSFEVLGGVEIGEVAEAGEAPESAVGQITGVNINPNGWIAEVYIQKMATNGTFDYGFAGSSNNIYTTTNFYLSLTSPGYDDDCETTTVSRVITGTKTIRFPYPSQTLTNRIATNADHIIISCALEDYVAASDSAITATFSTNWYVGAAGGNIATNGVAVTNQSTQVYGKVLAQNAWVPFDMVTNDTYTLQVVAFHRSAHDGRPVRAVKFWAKDQDGHTNEPVITTNVTKREFVFSVGGVLLTNVVQQFQATLYCTNFTSQKTFTNYFAAYPFWGDSASVWDSSDGTYDWASQYAGPFLLFCNRSNDFGRAWAVVDPAVGTAAGVVTSDGTYGAPFSNWVQAAGAIGASNNAWYSRNDHAGGTIWLTNGLHTIFNASLTARGKPETWLHTTRHPDASSNLVVIITNAVGSLQNDLKLKFSELMYSNVNNNQLFIGDGGFAWIDMVHKWTNNGANSAFIRYATNSWITRCTLDHQAGDYKKYDATMDNQFWIGNWFTGPSDIQHGPLVLGNLFLAETNAAITVSEGSSSFNTDPFIIAFNRFYRLEIGAGYCLAVGKYFDLHTGVAVIQNLFERTDLAASGGLIDFYAVAPPDNMTNLLCWNNTFIGQRWFDRYNDTADYQLFSVLDRHANNVSDEIGIKHDTFGTQNAARTNRWNVMYSVARSGECWGGLYSGGSFHPQSVTINGGFNGIGSLGLPDAATNTVDAIMGFKNPQAYRTQAVNAAGFGDYTPTNSSVLIGLERLLVLPYDLIGVPRYVGGAAGAFEYVAP